MTAAKEWIGKHPLLWTDDDERTAAGFMALALIESEEFKQREKEHGNGR